MDDTEMKVGDTVVVSRRWTALDLIDKIESETPKYWRVGGTLYSKGYGNRIRGADEWLSGSIRLPKNGEIEKIRFLEARKKVANIQWDDVAEEKIRAILKIMESPNE